MPFNKVDTTQSGGYILPKHVYVRPVMGADISDGHVEHPTGDPKFGLVPRTTVAVGSFFPPVSVARNK